MADIKRARYFDQQLLLLRDFTDEQSYHIEMRRRHNRLLHTAGVADGLDVTRTGVNEVTVKAGMALDNQGREVVLDADTKIDLGNATSSSILITLNYEESATDFSASDTNQNTRIKESGRVAVFKEGIGAALDDSAVQLARVTFDANGGVDKVDLSVRKQAGASTFDKPEAALTAGSLRLSIPTLPSALWPSLTASDSNQVTIGGGLVAEGPITTGSDLNANSATIRSTLSVTGDLVVGSAGTPSKLQVAGAIVPSVGNSAGAGIQFPSNPGGGSDDEAYIRYFVTSGEVTKLQIGIGNDWDDTIGLVQAGAERLTIARGNIGVGTPAPDAPLRVKQSASALAFKVTANRVEEDAHKQPIAEFRHDNEGNGVGIGYSSIFATGLAEHQDLSIFARGNGTLYLNREGGGSVVVGNALHVTGPVAPLNGIQFPPVPGSAGGGAYIRYFPTSGTIAKLQIDVGNSPNDSIGLAQAGAERLTISNGGVTVGKSLTVDGPITSKMWRATQVFNYLQGKLVLRAEFPSMGGTLIVFASGSGRAPTAGLIGMIISIDDKDKGYALCWTNEIDSHKAFVANAIVVTGVPAGSHTLSLKPFNNTITDFNDFFNVTVLEMPW